MAGKGQVKKKEDSVAKSRREEVKEREDKLKKHVSVLEAQLREKEEALGMFREALREKEEEMKEIKKVLIKYAPTPLWDVLTGVQYRYIFESHILWRLDELSFRVFREVNTESRDAVRRSQRKLKGGPGDSLSGRRRRPLNTFGGEVNIFSREAPRWRSVKEAQAYFCSEAVRSGNLSLLRWLQEEKKFAFDKKSIETAAVCGHLHIVKYCLKKKCPHDTRTCAYAAEHGHLKILKYLHNAGAPWDSKTCASARKNNHLECLVYALDNRCPNDKHQNHYDPYDQYDYDSP